MLTVSAIRPGRGTRDDVAASCLDDHVNVLTGREGELFDRGGDQADDPGEPAGADHGLGFGAVGDDSLHRAGDEVLRAQAGDRSSGQQDVLGADQDDDGRARFRCEVGHDQRRPVVEPEQGGGLPRQLALDAGRQGIAEVFQVVERWAANAGQDVERRAFRKRPDRARAGTGACPR